MFRKPGHLRWANFHSKKAGLGQLIPEEHMDSQLRSSHLSSAPGCLCWQQASLRSSGKVQKVTGRCGTACLKEGLLPVPIRDTNFLYSFQNFLVKNPRYLISELFQAISCLFMTQINGNRNVTKSRWSVHIIMHVKKHLFMNFSEAYSTVMFDEWAVASSLIELTQVLLQVSNEIVVRGRWNTGIRDNIYEV